MKRSFAVGLLLLVFTATVQGDEDPFAAGVRPTEPLTPTEQQRTFRLPPGFRAQLFASEPDIQKPMNMAFDARGRLWLTDSSEYPYAAPDSRPGRDTVKILEDTTGDGRADQVITFADGLNIPIGVLPYGSGALVYSIPNIWYLADTTGDDRADQREIILGPFDVTRDTHGMNNAFRRGFDGWIYACHGFANQSTVTAKDGSSVTMHSGNTYRFQPDGSRIEHFTWGQVNPFGMTFDPLGQIFTADCHTKPIMLLIRGGYYDSFGRPHDGLGYVPGVMEHDHGSTAIAGSVYYTGEMFPPEYRGNIFAGNVMTSRVNRDTLHYTGSTVRAHEEPDFIATDDPWFRPVDMQIGPDGALYIADFYNRIIGHYEVPLEHPGRDRFRGRIWRITYEGPDARPSGTPNLAQVSISALIKVLGHPVLPMRMRATDALLDRFGHDAVEPLRHEFQKPRSPESQVQAMWGLHRLEALQPADLARALDSGDLIVQVHALRVLAETTHWDQSLNSRVHICLSQGESLVQRIAAEALIAQPSVDFLRPLVELYLASPSDDVHLRHTVKIAVRNILREPGSLQRFAAHGIDTKERALLAEICLGLPTEDAALFLMDCLEDPAANPHQSRLWLTHIARHLPQSAVDRVVQIAQRQAADDLDLQLELLLAVRNGLQQRGLNDSPSVVDWAAALVEHILTTTQPAALAWRSTSRNGKPDKLWSTEQRASNDGAKAPFLSSLTLGEGWRGTLRSQPFTIPAQLHFYLCGHLGPPDQPAIRKNVVRLRLHETDEIIAEAFPPRNDVAQQVAWDLTSHHGARGYLEIVDGLDTPGYAWIAVGRFEPAVVAFPDVSPHTLERRLTSCAELVTALGIDSLTPALAALASYDGMSLQVRAACAQAMAAQSQDPASQGLAAVLDQPALDESFALRITEHLGSGANSGGADLLAELMQTAPSSLQHALAQGLARNRDGAQQLLEFIEQGKASAYLLDNQTLIQQLKAALAPAQRERIDSILATLPSRDAAVQQLIAQRQRAFAAATPSTDRGQQVFQQRCAACHQIAGQGAVIGPQLDGIGNRGVERILEDILDPNRNIDQAFRMHTYVLDDGRVLNGLPRRVEGELQVIADQEGKELSFPLAAVEENEPSPLSLMPETLGAQIPEDEFVDLVAYLSALRADSSPPSNGEPSQ